MSINKKYLFRIALATLLASFSICLLFIPLSKPNPSQTKEAMAEFNRYIPIESPVSGETLGYAATYKFKTDDGKEIDAQDGETLEWGGTLRRHDKLAVYYNPENPQEITVKSTSSLVPVSIALLVMSVIVFLSIPKKLP